MPQYIDIPRKQTERRESLILSPRAAAAAKSRGREVPEEDCDVRTAFQRDIDRITYSKSFRRLMHKTQVFLRPEGDHYRTRLTHTLEVSRISRTVARALRMNEDLTEATALGHDLGHTPFGHAGERALDAIMREEGGFRHNEQSLRVVDKIERDGRGLNLTYEVRDGILNHPRTGTPSTVEGEIVRLCDRFAYVNHDADDAERGGIIMPEEIPKDITAVLGVRCSERINTLVTDLINEFETKGEAALSPDVSMAFNAFYSFLNERLYKNPRAKGEETKVFGILNGIFGYYADNDSLLPEEYLGIKNNDGLRRAVCDYIAGMTDGYALEVYRRIFIPNAWELSL